MIQHSNYSLKSHNTFGIDQKCRRFITIQSIDDAVKLHTMLSADEPLLIIGRGSNLLLTQDFEGTVVRCDIRGTEVVNTCADEVLVRCGAGETVDDVIAWAINHGYYGMENLSHIPGEVGASAVQNVGAYGVEAKDIIDSVEMVELFTGNVLKVSNEDCKYSYRQSRFKGEWKNRYLITHVTYRLSLTFVPHTNYGGIQSSLTEAGIGTPTAADMRRIITEIRQSKLPNPDVTGNAGSFFMNPIVEPEVFEQLQKRFPALPYYDAQDGKKKIPAGWLIDQCGWKGRSVGNAAVHSRQALVLINNGGATGSEVVNLCRMIQKDVLDTFGVSIHPEVNII